jgi:galactose mutarotase-like enzyme
MLHTIENEHLTAVINDRGAELTRLDDRADGTAYLWDGDPRYWTGHAPLLFPIVGKLKGDEYVHEGKTYRMPKHGFARGEDFRVARREADALTLVFDGWEKHFDQYPFRYALEVTFSLEGRTLHIRHTVRNLDAEAPMYFSLGAHPAIACRGGYLEFPEEETLSAHQFGPDMLIRDEKTPFLDHARRYALLPETFAHDAYVLEGLRSPYVDVHGEGAAHAVRVTFGGAKYVGIWAKAGAPYVCIEPWEGLDDDQHQTGVLKEKKGIVALPAGRTHDFAIEIQCR